ncbi:MAG: thioredoxin [Lentisphaeria bacterium]|nr:thioredoxin [Lentisphaeria bacterium]
MAGTNTLIFTEENFETEVLKSDLPVLVDFGATWCGPCRAIGPVIDQVADETAGKAKVGKVDVDEAPGLAAKYGIRSVPTLLFIKNGDVTDKQVGRCDAATMIEKLGV